MMSHASRKTKHFPPRLRSPFLTLTLPTVVSCQPGPCPFSRPRELFHYQDESHREKSHSQLGGPVSAQLWKNLTALGFKVSPSHLAKSFYQEDLLCERASPECRKEISLNVSSRGNTPSIGDLPSDVLIGF